MARSWTTLAAALPYGYSLQWVLRREGIPTLFMAYQGDAIAPSGYDLDATLVLDRSARIGSVVDGAEHVAKGYDLEFRLLPSTSVDAYLRRPERYTVLTADLTASATTAEVASTSGWSGLSELYIGASCIPFAGIADAGFTGLTRGAYGRDRSYRKGALVTDGPYVWQGAQVDLFAVLLDPSGRYVQGADILSDAALMWSGFISERPVRDGLEWVFVARDQVRRVADPIGVAASGSVVWDLDDDALVTVPTGATFGLYLELLTTGVIADVQVEPFAAFATQARASELRQAVVDALTAATAAPEVLGYRWNRTEQLDQRRTLYELTVAFNPAAGDTAYEIRPRYSGPQSLFFSIAGYGHREPIDDTVGREERGAWIFQQAQVVGASLSVLVDDGDPSLLPTSGVVLLEGAGRRAFVRYTGLTIDGEDPAKVHLTLASEDRLSGSELEAVLAGERADVSARFLWADSGPLADVLRRALVSTGDAQHGTYDTLPKGQGLGLSMIDEASFDTVFAGIFADITWQTYVDSGSSVAKVYGDLFKLSRRGLVTCRSADGAAVNVKAVDLGSIDSGVPTVTITADVLVSVAGRRPVRTKSAYRVPQSIRLTCHTAPVGSSEGGEGTVLYRAPHLLDWTGTAWELDIEGVDRDALLTAGSAWAFSWFRSGENAQDLELDVAPWVGAQAQAGDVIELDLPDAALWDYATGTEGLSGLARVKGSTIDPSSGVTTISIAADGIYAPGPMCPSIPILALAGGATTPTSIDVDEDYYDLFEAARDGGSAYLLAYLPGQDVGTARYVYNAVSLPGGGVARLAITSYPSSPSVTLTTSYRLTWMTSADATTTQARYLHTDQAVQWS